MEITSSIVDDPTVWRETLDADKAYQAQRPDSIVNQLAQHTKELAQHDGRLCLTEAGVSRVEQAQDVDNTHTNNRIDKFMRCS